MNTYNVGLWLACLIHCVPFSWSGRLLGLPSMFDVTGGWWTIAICRRRRRGIDGGEGALIYT